MRKLLLALFLFFPLSVFATDYCADADCMACWKAETGSGTTVSDDASSDAVSDTMTFAASTEDPSWSATVPSDPGTATTYSISFDGDDYMSTPNSAESDWTGFASGQYTKIAWVYTDLVDTDRCVISITDTGVADMETMRYDVGEDEFQNAPRCDGAFQYSKIENTQLNPATSTWYHLVSVWDSVNDPFGTNDELAIYERAVLGDIGDTVDDCTTPNDADTALFIGHVNAGGRHWDGLIDEIAIFDDVLTTTEMDDIKDNGLDGSGAAVSRRVIMVTDAGETLGSFGGDGGYISRPQLQYAYLY